MKRNTIIFIALPILLSSCLGRLDGISVDPTVLLQSMLSAGAQSPVPAGFTVGGQIYGDTPSGLDLSLSGGTGCGGVQNLSPAATGIYQFVGIPDGCMGTGITITTQPTGVYCQIYNNTGLNVSGANVTGADLYCFSVEMPATTQTTIEGNSNTASIRLSASPGPGGITVNFTSGSGAVTTTASLSFTSANFSTYQNLTLTGAADGNLSSETVTISADVATHAMGGFDTTTLDTTATGMARFIYVTSGTHNGNFASDAALLGSNWAQRADHYCSLNSNRPVSLVGTGNYRALLTGASTRRSDSGAQLDWPLRAGISMIRMVRPFLQLPMRAIYLPRRWLTFFPGAGITGPASALRLPGQPDLIVHRGRWERLYKPDTSVRVLQTTLRFLLSAISTAIN